MKKTLFLVGLWMALLAATAQAGTKCEVYIAHTCTSVTVTAEGFPENGQSRIEADAFIGGVETREVREFSSSELAFTLTIPSGNEAVNVRVRAETRSEGKVRHVQVFESFSREGCVQAPKPPKSPPSVHVSKFFGDPLINIMLSGPGHFTVRGGDNVLNLKGAHVVTRYHVLPGHTLRIYVDGQLVLSRIAP